MKTSVKIFPTPIVLAEKFAGELVQLINESSKKKKPFTIALSGGSTPELLLSILGDRYSNSVPWDFVHFFWGDERCVAADNIESNYGMTKRVFLDKINIIPENIHRIIGENDPFEEAVRYSDEIKSFTVSRGGIPAFDLIILGLGEDGHIASIFPGKNAIPDSEKICEVAIHPLSFQKRITLTVRILNNAVKVFFMVTGSKKAEIVQSVIRTPENGDYPACLIKPVNGTLKWYLDENAAKMVGEEN